MHSKISIAEPGNPELTVQSADKSVVVEVREGQYGRVSLPLISADVFQGRVEKG